MRHTCKLTWAIGVKGVHQVQHLMPVHVHLKVHVYLPTLARQWQVQQEQLAFCALPR